MRSIRRWILVCVVFTAACDPGLAPAHRRALERGRDAAGQWITASAGSTNVAASVAIATGYLERLRLGLGSPFRLADYALQDARLASADRHDLAWAILARTLDRDAYRPDPTILDGIDLTDETAGQSMTGSLHLGIIDGAIRGSDDPRAGEQAVRRAYGRAAADGVVTYGAPLVAAHVAALLRDRELARHDVSALLDAARQEDVDPLKLLGQWRAGRRFAVEAPVMFAGLAGPAPAARDPNETVTRITQSIRDVAGDHRAPQVGPLRSESLLGRAAAGRLAALAEAVDAPPQSPVVLAVINTRSRLCVVAPGDDTVKTPIARFVENAVTEERFVAEYALLGQDVDRAVSAVADVGLAAAIALRAYAQEPVWFPGFAAPSAAAVATMYGLAEVRFADDVPPGWHPYYARMLDLALADLVRVMPALDLSGLRVLITGRHGYGATYAVHEPRRRRIVLPTRTGAGALAHEIAHDIDWQVALRRYGVRGDYASDLASRSANDAFSLRLRDLMAASRSPGADGESAGHAGRPAEILARNVDWFVAVTLAAQGRSNGYLTSIQDDVLTGFGSARAPDASSAAGEALIAILDELAPVQPDSRGVWLARYGRTRPADRVAGNQPAGTGRGSAGAVVPGSN